MPSLGPCELCPWSHFYRLHVVVVIVIVPVTMVTFNTVVPLHFVSFGPVVTESNHSLEVPNSVTVFLSESQASQDAYVVKAEMCRGCQMVNIYESRVAHNVSMWTCL